MRIRSALPVLLASALAAAPPAEARRRLVPGEYPTVQAAVRAAALGDTVLVAEGVYRENLDFLGKVVVVASQFALDRDPAHIAATVLDGSQPAHPDTASVVRFVRGETRASVLEGFTVTGGAGTRWLDEHNAQGARYREGGGVLVAFASPTIRYNRIVGNTAVRPCDGCVSAGGGGLRVGDGDPLVEHNVIAGNEGMYGAGVVFNFSSGTLRHNVVAQNRVHQATAGVPTFGGGGIWAVRTLPDGRGPVVEHNTIADNAVESAEGDPAFAGKGGGVLARNTNLAFSHNVVWGNTQPMGDGFVYESPMPGHSLTATYNDVQDAAPAGAGNVSADPHFADTDYLLSPGSPAVDAGDPAAAQYDPEDPDRPGTAAAPALGTVRADLGTYGGPGAERLGGAPTGSEPPPPSGGRMRGWVYPNPSTGGATFRADGVPAGGVTAAVYDALGRRVRLLAERSWPAGPFEAEWDGRGDGGRPVTAGLYFVRLSAGPAAVVAPVTVLP